MDYNEVVSISDVNIFHEDELILKDVNLSIVKGEFVYLIGKVGSGKTSLIRTINAEIPLADGNCIVCGMEVAKIKRRKVPYLRRKMGVVFQDFKLLDDRSVNQNLEFILKSTGWKDKKLIKKRIDEVLKMVDLEYKGFKMPHQLSGGEQQRVVIARALLNNPELIIADEPTGNLDPATSDNILKLLSEINKTGTAIIMATHNYNLIEKYPARIIKCDGGKVVEDATE